MSGNVSNHIWVEDATKALGGYWVREKGTADGAALVSQGGFGSGEAPLIYNLTGIDQNGTTINVPAGRSIQYASVLFTPTADPLDTAGLADLEIIQGAILFDADSAAYATAALGLGGALPTGTNPQQFYKCRLKEWENHKLTAALVNGTNSTGRIDLRSSSTTITLACMLVLS